MSDLSLQRVGPTYGGSGTAAPFRGDATGAQVVTDAHGRFQEATMRGTLFWLDTGAGVTLAAANVTKSNLGTIELINGFFNPPSSNKLCVILKAVVATVSGTPGGGFYYNYYSGVSTVSSVATGVVRSGFLASMNAGNGSVCQPLVDVAVVTVPAITAAAIQMGSVGGPAAVAAGAGVYSVIDNVDGAIIVPPGTLFGLACHAAGTSHIVSASLVWEEVPYFI